MTWNKWIVGIVILLLAIGFGFMGGIYIKKPIIINNPVPIYIKGKDSLIVKKYYYAVHDTAKAEVKQEKAYGNFYNEKVFDKDTIKIKTNVEYSLLDSNFNFYQFVDLIHTKSYRIDTLLIKVPTEKIVYQEVPFWQKPFFVFLVGLISGLSIILFGGG